MKRILAAYIVLLSLHACQKNKSSLPSMDTIVPAFTTYTIAPNNHFSDQANYQSFSKGELNFKVIFDSSAIYQSVNPVNQYDVNKLFGFSEGDNHQQNSARIGWAWNKNALRLYAYVYGNGERRIKEISSVEIGKEILCRIKVAGDQYLFEAGQEKASLGRSVAGEVVPGYMLYPYFGGDETAPHRITIRIMRLN